MSQGTLTQDTAGAAFESRGEEFDYRPMPGLAPVTLVLGLSAVFGLFTELLLPIGLLAIVFGLIALRKIRKSNGEYGGVKLTWTGLLTGGVFLVSGTAAFIHAYATEVPDGHIRVSFPGEISRKGFVEENGLRMPHPDIQALVGKPIFVKGFMWNTNKDNDLPGFLLLKDNGKCCFGGDPAPNDVISVKMQDGMTVDYKEGLVAVAGTLRFRPDPANPKSPVYFLEATYFNRARTAY